MKQQKKIMNKEKSNFEKGPSEDLLKILNAPKYKTPPEKEKEVKTERV